MVASRIGRPAALLIAASWASYRQHKLPGRKLLRPRAVRSVNSSTMAYFPDRKIAAAFMYNTDTHGAISKRAHDIMVDLVKLVLAK